MFECVNHPFAAKGVQLSLVRHTKAFFHRSSCFLITLGPSLSALVSFSSYRWLFNVATSFVNGPVSYGRPPKIFQGFLALFLAIFTLFHWKNQLYLQKPDFRNLPETRFWLLLVNNTLSNRRTVYIMHLELNRQGEGDIQLCLWSCFNGIFVTLRRNKVFTFSMTNIKYFLTIWKIAFCHLSH